MSAKSIVFALLIIMVLFSFVGNCAQSSMHERQAERTRLVVAVAEKAAEERRQKWEFTARLCLKNPKKHMLAEDLAWMRWHDARRTLDQAYNVVTEDRENNDGPTSHTADHDPAYRHMFDDMENPWSQRNEVFREVYMALVLKCSGHNILRAEPVPEECAQEVRQVLDEKIEMKEWRKAVEILLLGKKDNTIATRPCLRAGTIGSEVRHGRESDQEQGDAELDDVL